MQDLLSLDFESEVEDDILAIFRKGEVRLDFAYKELVLSAAELILL